MSLQKVTAVKLRHVKKVCLCCLIHSDLEGDYEVTVGGSELK